MFSLRQKQMNASQIHAKTEEPVWMEYTVLLVYVQANLPEYFVKVYMIALLKSSFTVRQFLFYCHNI